jgi:hypothetical protein
MTASDRVKTFRLSMVRSLRGKLNAVIERHESESIFQPPYLSLRMEKCGAGRNGFGAEQEQSTREQSACQAGVQGAGASAAVWVLTLLQGPCEDVAWN